MHQGLPGRGRGFMKVLLFVSIGTARRSCSLFLVMDLPSILTLISRDLSNLALLYPIILITQTAALPHHLYANGLSLLW